MARCPTCGRTVETVFEHIDVECENWPDRGVKVPLTYRGYFVEWNSVIGGYNYCHKDYDEGDNRHGHEATREDVFRAIDESEEDA